MLSGSVYICIDECEDIAVKLCNISSQLYGIKSRINSNIASLSRACGKYYKSKSTYYVGEAAADLAKAQKCVRNAVEIYIAVNDLLFNIDWKKENDFSKLTIYRNSNLTITTSMSNEDKAMRDEFILQYELANPDEAEKLKNLFANSPAEYRDDIENIKYLAYTSTGDCHKMFFMYADKIGISEYSAKTESGNGCDFFSPSDGSMHLCFSRTNDDGSDRSVNYGTFFHEAGHNIDWLMGRNTENGYRYFTQLMGNDGIHSVLYSDVENAAKTVVSNYSINEKYLNEDQQGIIVDVLMGRKGEDVVQGTELDFAYRKAYEDITGQWKGKYSRQVMHGNDVGIIEYGEAKESGIVSEVFCGATNNTLMANNYADIWWNPAAGISVMTHPDDSMVTYGHSWEYLEDVFEGSDANPYHYYYNADGSNTGAVGKEFMAEYMRINMTNSEAERTYAKKYLPQSWAAMDSAIAEIVDVN